MTTNGDWIRVRQGSLICLDREASTGMTFGIVTRVTSDFFDIMWCKTLNVSNVYFHEYRGAKFISVEIF